MTRPPQHPTGNIASLADRPERSPVEGHGRGRIRRGGTSTGRVSDPRDRLLRDRPTVGADESDPPKLGIQFEAYS